MTKTEEIMYEIESTMRTNLIEIEMDEEMDETIEDSKMISKPKGVGMGKPKFKYDSKPNMGKGFNTKMKKGNPTMGTGKPKFEFKEGQGYDDKEDENWNEER